MAAPEWLVHVARVAATLAELETLAERLPDEITRWVRAVKATGNTDEAPQPSQERAERRAATIDAELAEARAAVAALQA